MVERLHMEMAQRTLSSAGDFEKFRKLVQLALWSYIAPALLLQFHDGVTPAGTLRNLEE